MWSMPLWSNDLPWVQWGVVTGASLAAAACDLRSRRIPNRLSLVTWCGGVLWACWIGGIAGALDGLAATLLLAAPFVMLWLYAGGGAGDAKFMGAIGAWLGVFNGLGVLVAVTATGAICGLIYAALKGRIPEVLARLAPVAAAALRLPAAKPPLSVLGEPGAKGLPMPYALSILIGVCVAAGGYLSWRT